MILFETTKLYIERFMSELVRKGVANECEYAFKWLVCSLASFQIYKSSQSIAKHIMEM